MKKVLIGIVILIAIVGGISLFSNKDTVNNPSLDEFAQCLTDKGTKMWGAYWCPHCKNQKAEFGKSWDKVTYIECSLPGGDGQTEECSEAGIEGYPTWEFEGGERLSGEVPLAILAEKTGCELSNE